MNKTQEQLDKLRKVAELSLNKTEELQKVLAQIEALMSNTELQEVSKKKKDQLIFNYIFNKGEKKFLKNNVEKLVEKIIRSLSFFWTH